MTVKQWRSKRSQSKRQGKIVVGGRVGHRPCTVIDASLSGVRILLDDDTMMPNSFILVVDAKRADCEIIWRKGRELGASVRSWS